uniref:Putative protease n=1 Tax=viral metagenome TaxID=1070528 RepID=A0A6H2A2E2_9ZZZZ
MKKLIVLIGCLMFMGCITVNPITPVKPDPHELVVRVEGDRCLDKETILELAALPRKTMTVENDELAFSYNCKVYEGKAYITIMSIGSYKAEDLWKDFRLMKLKGIKEAVIYLNSPGGEAFQGMAITDEFRIVKKDIHLTVEGRGLIASASIPVFLAADKRIASKNTIFLIHPASLTKWGFFTESLNDLKSQTLMIEILNEMYAESVAGHSKLSKEKVLELMKQDNWFTAQKAFEMGFIDEIK